MPSNDYLLPNELLYSICALVAAEYFDRVISGDLKYAPPPIPEDEPSVPYIDPALSADNPLKQLLHTSAVFRDVTLVAISDALGITTEGDTAHKAIAKMWSQIQPVRVFMHEALSKPLLDYDTLHYERRRKQFRSPLLQAYAEVASLVDYARSCPNRVLLLHMEYLRSTAAHTYGGDAAAAWNRIIPSTPCNILPVYVECTREFPVIPHDELNAFVHRRRMSVPFLSSFVQGFVARMTSAVATHIDGERRDFKNVSAGERVALMSSFAATKGQVDRSLGVEKDRMKQWLDPLYDDDDWDVAELLRVACVRPSEPIPPGDLETRLRWALEQLREDLCTHRAKLFWYGFKLRYRRQSNDQYIFG